MATAAARKFCAFWVAEYGKSNALLTAVGWVSLVPTVLLPSMSVAATALLPIVLLAGVVTQPSGDAAGSPSNDTTVRVSVDWVAVGCALTLNTRPVNVSTSE